MMDWVEYSAKTVEEALTEALIQLKTTSDNVEYEVLEKETAGFLGLFSKPARIRVKIKDSIENVTRDFLERLFAAMKIESKIEIVYEEANACVNINVSGEDMGILIGKRGQTLDSLQYLTSLVVNKESNSYLKVKLDTENYRERRKETLENLAKNISHKVKRTRKPVSLEPMNPYERRVIHSVLQNDKFVETHSEGEEPYRKVVVTLKKTEREYKPAHNRNYGTNNKDTKRGYKRDRSFYKDIDAKPTEPLYTEE